jgi:hypothetical protein
VSKISKSLIIAGAPPCSGSTLISWCFLQRHDIDGLLDARNDLLPQLPNVSTPHCWFKMTISVFRLADLVEHFRDEGWDVRPLLMVRDIRAVFNSMLAKSYTSNGTTAEDPPFRMRLRRFKQDWEQMRDRGAIIQYESLMQNPQLTLRRCCEQLDLPWDCAMLDWPKDRAQILDPRHGSPTFRQSLTKNFADTADAAFTKVRVDRIPPADLDWLEDEFAELNHVCGYEKHVARPSGTFASLRAIPSIENSRRARKQKPLVRIAAVCTRMTRAVLRTTKDVNSNV